METRKSNYVTPLGTENNMEQNEDVRMESGLSETETSSTDCQLESEGAKVVSGNESEGSRNMLIGAIWCAGGIIVTVASYSAVKDTGGTYFVAWGAVVFGGYQFLKGLFQTMG